MKLVIIAILTVTCIVLAYMLFKCRLEITVIAKWPVENGKIPTDEELERIAREILHNMFKKSK